MKRKTAPAAPSPSGLAINIICLEIDIVYFFGLMLVCFLLLDSLVYHRLLQFARYLCPI